MKKKLTKADRERLQRMEANAEWLRQLAEQGYAELERKGALTVKRPEPRPLRRPTKEERAAERARAHANAEWLRQLAERGKAELERREQREA